MDIKKNNCFHKTRFFSIKKLLIKIILPLFIFFFLFYENFSGEFSNIKTRISDNKDKIYNFEYNNLCWNIEKNFYNKNWHYISKIPDKLPENFIHNDIIYFCKGITYSYTKILDRSPLYYFKKVTPKSNLFYLSNVMILKYYFFIFKNDKKNLRKKIKLLIKSLEEKNTFCPYIKYWDLMINSESYNQTELLKIRDDIMRKKNIFITLKKKWKNTPKSTISNDSNILDILLFTINYLIFESAHNNKSTYIKQNASKLIENQLKKISLTKMSRRVIQIYDGIEIYIKKMLKNYLFYRVQHPKINIDNSITSKYNIGLFKEDNLREIFINNI